jgi:hypothetical protein
MSEYLTRGQTFDHPNDFGDGVGWNPLDQNMHMILIRSYLKKPHMIPFLDFQTHLLHDLIDLLVNDCPSIFCRQHHMIKQDGYVMTFMDVFAHFSILRRKRWGIQPLEIQKIKSALLFFSFYPQNR